jgi:alkanesulfonate monooxygenase SsuD/methylene tetrahydromethanopterin reductase-like flavin-dependent oxidoreductase (luciferase family)
VTTGPAPTKVGFLVDFRNPPAWRRDPALFHSQQLELARVAERSGVDSLWVTEHHFAQDGYCPAPLLALAALASVTEAVTLGTWVLLLALRHPVQVAEEAAFVDNLSGGRVVLGAGAGYRAQEFAGLGVDLHRLRRLMDEKLEVLLRALREPGPFDFHGELLDLEGVAVTPRPLGPLPVLVGSTTAAADARAVRLGADGLAVRPTGDRYQALLAACRAAGRDAGSLRFGMYSYVHIAEDPERGWELVGPHVAYGRGEVEGWFKTSGVNIFPAGLRESVAVGSPAEVAARLAARLRKNPEAIPEHLVLHLLHPGLPFEVCLEQVERLGREVIPLLRKQMAEH